MNSIEVFPDFARQLKRLHKKYPTLKIEIAELIAMLTQNAAYGTSLGDGLYKIRIASKSKSGGKSSGFRVVTYTFAPILAENNLTTGFEIYLVTIYDKSELSTISKTALLAILKEYLG
jgi:hypothetical protein